MSKSEKSYKRKRRKSKEEVLVSIKETFIIGMINLAIGSVLAVMFLMFLGL